MLPNQRRPKQRPWWSLLAVLAASLALFLVSCDSDDDATPTSEATATEEGEATGTGTASQGSDNPSGDLEMIPAEIQDAGDGDWTENKR